jgi:hypothetical protein
MVAVKTQAELDQALADKAATIYIDSSDGVWLQINRSDSSHVVAWDSSHVVAWDSSHVEAWGSSHVEARGSSHVEAWDSSHVVARDSSHVEAATKYVGIHLHSRAVRVDGNGTIIDCINIDLSDPERWCEYHGVEIADGIAYVFKAVNREWTTDRGTDYSPGSLPEAADWDAGWLDCGRGLHFCNHPLRSLDFLGGRVEDARFLKCGVRLDEMVTLDDKAKARRVVVGCVEVDRYGRPVDTAGVFG